MKRGLFLFICIIIIIFVFYKNSYRNSAYRSEFSLTEAENILRETWGPIKEFKDSLIVSNPNEKINLANYINNKQKLIINLENKMDKSIVEGITSELFKNPEVGIKSTYSINIPTIYDEEVSVRSAYVKKYKRSGKEELVIYEDGKYKKFGDFYRTNIYYKNNKRWILYSIEGITNYKMK